MTHLTAYPRVGSTSAPTPGISKQFDSLVIIDRAADLITPFLTQLTYEGLLDEYFGIKNCKYDNKPLRHLHITTFSAYIEVNPELLSSNPTSSTAGSSTAGALGGAPVPTKKKKHLLTASNDEMLGRLRDLNFAIVGGKLNAEARRLEAAYDVSEFSMRHSCSAELN
jgi:hypothetical protein